jgi:hypothetical protein
VCLACCPTGSCFLIIIHEYSRILNRIRVRIEHDPLGLELNRECAIFDSIRFISTAGLYIYTRNAFVGRVLLRLGWNICVCDTHL